MKWSKFGPFLSKARIQAGIAQQSDLAGRLGVSQQTISRWENGQSRPRSSQIPALASLLRCNTDQLLEAAGYTPEPETTISLDQPWPLQALSPESFERFCADFLQRTYKEARVNPYGAKGHKQNGLDIEARFTDGPHWTYQCKRHSTFGPQKIRKAVEAHHQPADKKHLLISCYASPQAREEVKRHAEWELWDKEDISRHIRQNLSKVDQRILVDTYFPGQRKALIGELEPSPWQEPKQFFAGMTRDHSGFSHLWNLVGRRKELDAIVKKIEDSTSSIILLSGAGGSGKTRLIKAAMDRLALTSKHLKLYLLSRDRLTSKSLEELGTDPKLLVCDDAHERDELGLLTDYVSNPANQAQLLLAYRQYGEQYIKQMAPQLLLDDTPKIKLQNLTPAETEDLASQALKVFGADLKHAERLGKYTQDCPLATIIGAQILAANSEIEPDFLHSEQRFRDSLMLRLVETIVSGAGCGLDESAFRKTLEILALLQPIYDSDESLIQSIENITSIPTCDIRRIVQRLKDAGIVFQRGRKSRISPDLLGDFLIERACVAGNHSTGFAERVFSSLPSGYVGNLLVNLGRLDWRMSGGDTRQSKLLDSIWRELDHSEAHSTAIADMAFYQPGKSIRYAKSLISSGKTEKAGRILRNVAYNSDYLHDVCELLWKMGKDDHRPLNAHPWHGIRVLNELGTPEPGKPLIYCKDISDFSIHLFSSESNWNSHYSPLDILSGVLSTEGHITTQTSRSFRMSPYCIRAEAMQPIRRKIVSALIGLLEHENSSVSYRAARRLHDALRYPMGLLGASVPTQSIRDWECEFIATLKDIEGTIQRRSLSPTTLMGLAKSVSWHAHHSQGKTSETAKKILKHLDRDLFTQSIRMLMDGWGHATASPTDGRSWETIRAEMNALAGDLTEAFPEPNILLQFIRKCLIEIRKANPGNTSPPILIDFLIERSSDLAYAIALSATSPNDTTFNNFFGLAYSRLLKESPDKAHQVVSGLCADISHETMTLLASAYTVYRPTEEYTEEQQKLLKILVEVPDRSLDVYKPGIIRSVADTDSFLAKNLLMSTVCEPESSSLHELFLLLSDDKLFPLDSMVDSEIDYLISIIEPLMNLEDHWVHEFLTRVTKRCPEKVVSLLKARLERSISDKNWAMRPAPYGPYISHSFGLLEHPDGEHHLVTILEWAIDRVDDYRFSYRLGEVIHSLCSPFDESFITVLNRPGFRGGSTI